MPPGEVKESISGFRLEAVFFVGCQRLPVYFPLCTSGSGEDGSGEACQ